MGKTYFVNAEGDDHIHVAHRRTIAGLILLCVVAGVAVVFLQGGAV